jgi:hypothetical protein
LLTEAALRGVIEEFITREGTDYGEREVPLQAKVDEVSKQLSRGEVVISFDPADGSLTLVPRLSR